MGADHGRPVCRVIAVVRTLTAGLTGVDETAIWEWGFLERVSTGTYLLDLGAPGQARPFLETAALLTR